MADPTPVTTEGYCPACGRGDCTPTAEQWSAQVRRAEAAEGGLRRLRAELAEARRELEATHVRAKTAVKRRNDVKAERDALKAAITEATRLIREWMTPGAPLFDPGHAQQVMAILRRTIGDRTLAALAVPESPAAARTPVSTPTEAHGETGEAQEGSRCRGCGGRPKPGYACGRCGSSNPKPFGKAP